MILRQVVILLFFSIGFAKAQNLIYDVFVDNKLAGKMTITKSNYINNNSIIDFNLEFEVEAIGKNKIKQYAICSFKKGLLVSSEFVLERNERIRESCTTKLVKGGYIIERKNQNQITDIRFINNTLISLFIAEPKNLQVVFAERYGDFCEIKTVGQGIYEVTLPIGGSVRYHYKNGICMKTESVGTMQDIQIKLKTK